MTELSEWDRALPLKTEAIYFVFDCLWLLVSDRALHLLADHEPFLEGFQTFKGILFVLLSALLIFCVIRYEVTG